MISSYISYLRLINDKLIRNGINLGITLKDDMSVDELEDAKAMLESYCYFNDVLILCDSAYALDLVDGCKVKLYTDLVKEEVYKQYNEKFEIASTLLQSGMDNPLDEVKEPQTLSGYLKSLGKSSVKDLAVSVSADEPKKVSVENLGDLFNISNEPKFDYVEDDSDEDEEFDYSDDNDEDAEGQEEISENEEDDDSDVFFDFRNKSDEDEEPDEEDFDYSDDSEVFENAEELPLTDDEDGESAEFDYSDDNEEVFDSDEEEDFNYSDDEEEVGTSEADEEDSDEEEFDYSDDTEDSEEDDFNYSDDEYSEDESEIESEDEEFADGYSDDDEDFNYSDDDSSSEDEEEDFDYSDDEDANWYSEDDEDIDYSDDNDDSEEDIDYSDDNESEEDYDEDYEEEPSGYDDEPMFNVGTSPHVQTAPRPKEAYEKDAELIEGIVDGGAKLLKSVGNKVMNSLFNGKK